MSAIHFDYVVDEHMRRYDVIGRNDARRYDLVVVSHIGTNPETQRQIIASELEVELCPQGTLGERIHGHSRHNGNRRAG